MMSAPPEKPAEVLVLDDELDAQDLLKLVLERRGYTVYPSGSGEEALRLIEEKQIAVALVDLLMPGMSGLEFLSRLAELPGDHRPVVLLISAKRLKEVQEMVRGLGVFQIIEKPFELREVEAHVDRAAEEKLRLLQESG
jgi:CheY-like chemotaxis protein